VCLDGVSHSKKFGHEFMQTAVSSVIVIKAKVLSDPNIKMPFQYTM
jgi:hypothetical protein